MPPSPVRRRLHLALVAVLVALLAGVLSTPTAQARGQRDRIELPDGFQPEGIAISGHTAFFGSRVDGDLYKADLRTGRGRVFSQGPGTQSLGLKTDRHHRLFVAGGSGGDGRVVDTRSGRVLRSYTFTTNESFVNDVVLTRHRAWFTDSLQAQLYGVPLGRHGRPLKHARVVTLPLAGEWEQVPEENNANGIARTPDHRALLVIQSATGFLFRVNPHTGVARRVDLGDTLLTNGDGLLLKGRTLFAVQNQLNQVAVVRLSRSGRSGNLVDTITSPDFDVPTTLARRGHSLWAPNARFTTPAEPDTAYWATRIRIPHLH